MMPSLIQGLDLSSLHICSNNFVFRFSADLDRMKKGAAEALRKHRGDIAAGTEQLPQDPQLYWARMRPICATRLADVAVDLLTCPASSVPSERLFSVAGVMCAGEPSIHQEIDSYFLLAFFFIRKKTLNFRFKLRAQSTPQM